QLIANERVENHCQHELDFLACQSLWIHQVFDHERVRYGAQGHRAPVAGNRKLAAQSIDEGLEKFPSGSAQCAVAINQPKPGFRVANREQLELQLQKRPSAVASDARVVVTQSVQALHRTLVLLEDGSHSAYSLGDDPFHQREQQVFLALEVCVERPSSEPRAGGDVLEARRLKPISRKDVSSGIE